MLTERPARSEVPAWVPALVAALVSPAFLTKLKDYDVWWHLATGRWIVEHHALPTVDPFTYTMVGKPWHLVNGIAEVVMYAVYREGGETGLVLLKALCAFATLTMVGLCLREIGARRVTVIALVLATALLVHGRYTQERPMILGAALLAACQWLVLRSHARRDRSYLFFLVALPIWPLVHGTALLGVAQLGALLAAEVLGRAPRRRVVSIAVTLAVSLALTAVLPWWRGLYLTSTGLAGGATATLFTAEWRSGAEALHDRVGHWIVVVVALIGGTLVVRRDASRLLLAIVAAVISWKFARNAYEGIILSMPAFAGGVEHLAERLRGQGRELSAAVAAPIAALCVCTAQFTVSPFRTMGGPFGIGVVRGRFPYDTLVTLRRLPEHRLMNGFPIGGFLIWNDGPWGVYTDGRTVALYGEEDVQHLFMPMLESAETLTAAADRWHAVYGLDENMSIPMQWMMVSHEWVPLHIGEGTSLFIRSTHLDELPHDVMPLSLVRLTEDVRWNRGWYSGLVTDRARREALAQQFAEAARLSPGNRLLAEVIRVVAPLDEPYAEKLKSTLGGP